MTENKPKSILTAFKDSSDNFLNNQNELKEIGQELKSICDSTLSQIKSGFQRLNPDASQQIEEYFANIKSSKQPSDTRLHQRRECTPEEEQLIRDVCLKAEKGESDVEDIKYSLGFKSQFQTKSPHKNPCVAFIGQKICGKTSLIRSFLRENIPQLKLTHKNPRLLHMSYCNTAFVALMKDSKLIEIAIGETIQSENLMLKFADKRSKEKVHIQIHVGVVNPVLQSGFDIVETPGLNETPELNELCKRMQESLLPLLVYVIDSRNGLTESDRSDIKNIQKNTPQIKIIYFSTKLDRTEVDRILYQQNKTKKGFKPEEDLPGESDIEVANRRLRNTFNNLQKHLFVSPTQSIEQCPDYNGANLSAIQSFRIQGRQPKSVIDEYNFKLMEKCERNLLNHLKDMMEEPLIEEIQSLQTSLENIIEILTLSLENTLKEKCLETIQKYLNFEDKIYKSLLDKIRHKLNDKMPKVIEQCEKSAKRFLENPPEEKHRRFRDFPSRMDICDPFMRDYSHPSIRGSIEQALVSQMKDLAPSILGAIDDFLIEDLQSLIQDTSFNSQDQSSYEVMLRNRLLHDYDLREENNTLTRNKTYNFAFLMKQKTEGVINDIRNAISDFMVKHPKIQHGQKSSENPRSDEEEAIYLISELKGGEFLENVFSKVTKELRKFHDSFHEKSNKETLILQCDLHIGESERSHLAQLSDRLAILYTRVQIVKTAIQLTLDPTKESEPLENGQTKVEKVCLVNQDLPIIRKTYRTVFKHFESSMGFEVYYTSRLNNLHILKLYGIKKQPVENGFTVICYHPYVTDGSLKNYLDQNSLDLKSRLKLSIQVAQSLELLHELGIVHRDITLDNIKVQTSSSSGLQAIISDFSMLDALASLSFYPQEEPNEALELDVIGCTFAGDVYSFGVCLWQILSYKLCPKYDNLDPQFVIDCEFDKSKINEMIINTGARPEHRDLIPEQLNNFLDKCWSTNKDERPSFISRNKGKTIAECLRDVYKCM